MFRIVLICQIYHLSQFLDKRKKNGPKAGKHGKAGDQWTSEEVPRVTWGQNGLSALGLVHPGDEVEYHDGWMTAV